MKRRDTFRKRAIKIMKKWHNKVVEHLAERPEILGIAGLTQQSLLCQPLKFPQLKKKGEETGDIIFIWLTPQNEVEILVAEVTIGAYRKPFKYLFRLKKTLNFLRKNWERLFSNLGLDGSKVKSLWIRTIYLNYGGKLLIDTPFILQKRTKIF